MGFPTVASQPVSRDALMKALNDRDVLFAGIAELKDAATWKDVDLFVLPYGSAVPAEAWGSIQSYLRDGGNLLVLGGEALRVPVTSANGKFVPSPPQDTYARELGFEHSYEVPVPSGSHFAWRDGYSFLQAPQIRARRFFTTEGGLDGFGYMMNAEGERVAAPVVVKDHTSVELPPEAMLGSRIVLLDFEPEPGYWESPDGLSLIRESAEYARQGATSFWVEAPFSTIKPDEPVNVVVHLRNARRERLGLPLSGEVKLELLSGEKVLQSARVPCAGAEVDAEVSFHTTLPPGFYTIRGIYEDAGQPREFYQNALWVEDQKLLTSGPTLGVQGDFLTRDGKPFFPVGSNYFSTEANGWDFSGPRNAWDLGARFRGDGKARRQLRAHRRVDDPSALRRAADGHGDAAIRAQSGGVSALRAPPQHLRQLHIFCVRSAHGHARLRSGRPNPARNPYTGSGSIRGEQDYILSVVNRFRNVPGLCWDLINEPSFSNPNRLWKGNTPNNDPDGNRRVAQVAAGEVSRRGRAGRRVAGHARGTRQPRSGSAAHH